MPVPFASNIELLSKLPNFSRDMFDTKSAMKSFPEYNLPDIFITTCKEDGNVYVFNRNNEVNTETGKWRAINASGSSSYNALSDKPAIDGHTLSSSTTLDNLGLYDKITMDGILGSKVDKDGEKVLSDNNFTNELKEKLDGIESGAKVNVQSDWNETDDTRDSFIKNKPTLFSGDYEDLANKPVNLSDFTNDSGFVKASTENLINYFTKDQTYTQEEVNSKIGAIATLSMLIVDELPAEGNSKIIYLIKKTGSSGYVEYIYTMGEWADIGDTDVDLADYVKKTDVSDVGKTGNYSDLIGKPVIPENVSELNNDANYVTIDDTTPTADNPYSGQKVEALFANLTGSALEKEVTSSVDVGGIKEGDVFTVGTTLTDIVSKLLEKYIAPVIGISISPSTTIYEKGSTIDSIVITAAVTKKSEEIAKVEFLIDNSVVETVTEGVSAGGSFTYTDDSGVTANRKYTVRTSDVTTGTVRTADKAISFVVPYYHGVSDSDTISSISGLTKDVSAKGSKTYSFTAENKYCVIMYDSNYPDLTSIKDQNNFENISNFSKKTVTIGDTSYKYYVTTGRKTITGFKFTFA